MQFVVLWRDNNPKIKNLDRNGQEKKLYYEEICENEEALAAFIQRLQIEPKTRRRINKNIESHVYPYFKKGEMVLNIKTFETRIVLSVNCREGVVTVYNIDHPDGAKLQEIGYVPTLTENWSIEDCVPVDVKKVITEYGFKVGTEMGVHPEYSKLRPVEMEKLLGE